MTIHLHRGDLPDVLRFRQLGPRARFHTLLRNNDLGQRKALVLKQRGLRSPSRIVWAATQ
jgi:hypothetical protein